MGCTTVKKLMRFHARLLSIRCKWQTIIMWPLVTVKILYGWGYSTGNITWIWEIQIWGVQKLGLLGGPTQVGLQRGQLHGRNICGWINLKFHVLQICSKTSGRGWNICDFVTPVKLLFGVISGEWGPIDDVTQVCTYGFKGTLRKKQPQLCNPY